MLKRAVSGIMLTLLLVSTLALVFSIHPVKSEPATIVVPDDYPTIQYAINASSPGDTIYVRSGIYYENIDMYVGRGERYISDICIVGEDPSTTIIDAQGRVGILFYNEYNITLKSFTIRNGEKGIWVSMTNGGPVNLKIENNIIANNSKGIYFFNDYPATISNNVIEHNDVGLSGIVSRKNVSGNIIRSNRHYGIEFWSEWDLRDILISGNVITNNGDGGIFLRMTDRRFDSGNVVANNTIADNGSFGIKVEVTYDNRIYHNNFVNNTISAVTDSLNQWDNGYPSGGNYWSDYADIDLYGGPYQNETGSDGIWDHPYIIDRNNQDNYPFKERWSPVKTISATVDINPDTLNLKSRGRWITCYVELPDGYNVSDIDVTSVMLNDTVPVYPKTHAIGDYDEDGVPDLMVKFGRAEVIDYIMANVNMTKLLEQKFMTVALTITGKLHDGTQFQGNTTIRIIARTGLPKISTKISFTLSPNPAILGQTITLTGNLKNQLGDAIGNAPVEVYYSINNGHNWVHAGTIHTDSAGWFSAKGKLTIVGIFLIAVVYRGNFRYSQSYRIETLMINSST